MRPRDADLIDGLTPKQLQVLRHIAELQRKSLLTASPGRARSLRLTPQGRRVLRHARPPEGEDGEDSRAGVPLLGRVAAGLPVEAIENRETLSLRLCGGTGDDLFALEVRGDSMIEEDIRPGDYAEEGGDP